MLMHLITGAAVACIVTQNPLEFLCILFGSLLPDIDSKNSTLGRYNPVARFMKHRGHAHSLVGALLIPVPFMLFGIDAYFMIVVGSIVHLCGDKISSWLPNRRKFNLKIW